MLGVTLIRLLDAYELIIFIWVIFTWIPSAQGALYDIKSALGALTEPYLRIFRRFVPPVSGVDFSPIIAIVVLRLLQHLIAFIL